MNPDWQTSCININLLETGHTFPFFDDKTGKIDTCSIHKTGFISEREHQTAYLRILHFHKLHYDTSLFLQSFYALL